MVTRLKAYKFRFYPTAQQRHQLAVEFGNARFVWNRCLDWRSKAWEERQERHNYASLNRQVTAWKRTEFPWLADSAACCLTQCLMDQDRAFKNFFEKRGRYPKFKSRYDRQAVRYRQGKRRRCFSAVRLTDVLCVFDYETPRPFFRDRRFCTGCEVGRV